MLNKIHSNLIKEVKVLSDKKYDCIISSVDFFNTKKNLDDLNIKYKEYEFMNSFLVSASYENILKISDIDSVSFLVKTTKVNSQIYNSKKLINLEKLTENKYFGKNSNIAFIDTGISPHIDFIFPKNRIVEFVDLLGNKKSPYDDNGHGSFVAGVATGSGKSLGNKYSGIAPLANIIMIKALDENGETDSNKILDAMEYVYKNRKRLNIHVVCMSFGADDLGINDPLKRGAQALWNSGITVVVAGGNSGPESKTIKSPGTNQKIITVGGLDAQDETNLKVAEFSSRGPVEKYFKPDLLAPGVNIVGVGTSPNSPYIKMSGTSVATPIVAGVCAIIHEKYPSYTPDQIKYFLINHCLHLDYDRNNEGYGYLKFK